MPVGSVAGLVQKSGPVGAIETATEQRSEPSAGKSARQRSRHFPHLATPTPQGSRFAVDATGHAQLVLGVFGCALEDHVYRPAQRIRIHIRRERLSPHPLSVALQQIETTARSSMLALGAGIRLPLTATALS